MKRLTEMNDLRSLLFAISFCEIFSNLPVERRLQRVFDAKRAAFDKECMRKI